MSVLLVVNYGILNPKTLGNIGLLLEEKQIHSQILTIYARSSGFNWGKSRPSH